MTADRSPIRDYQSAAAFLFGRINYERTRGVPYRSRGFKLDRMRQLAARLGHPEQAFPAVHIAGTKGKGSTAAMIASVLTAAGYRTGLYTSPHLDCLEERFVVDGRPCDQATLVSLLARLQGPVLDMDDPVRTPEHHLGPTYFEITTAAALLYFQDRQVDVAVLEVGLGGRLDSTNICRSVTSVITSISFDHMRQLGTTLAAIAREKAGIIKPGVPVVTGATHPEPFQVIAQVARDNDAPLWALGRDFDFGYLPQLSTAATGHAPPLDWQCGLDYREQLNGRIELLPHVAIGLLGRHQAANASVAIAACHQLRRQGWDLDDAAIRSGLARAHCPARIEVLSRAPTVILDTAHNPASVAALVEFVLERCVHNPRLLVFAASSDKDTPAMLRQLLPHFDHVVLTQYRNNPRAISPDKLLATAHAIRQACRLPQLTLHRRPDPQTAWQLVESLASPAHLVCITGSFFLAAEMRPLIETVGGKRPAGT